MANELHNQKLPSRYPAKFNKRENRASTHNNSLVETDSAFTFTTSDGINACKNTGANTLTFPDANENKGRCLSIRQEDAATPTFANNDGATIESATLAAAGDWVEYFCTGTEWVIQKQFIA